MIRRIFSLIMLAVIVLTAWQHQSIIDWWFLRSYEPSTEIINLANKAQLSETGKRNFYLGAPQVDDKLTFNSHCPVGEESLVLGCYNGKIYILKVERKELNKVMEVTAAHEMLHAAYDRFSEDQKSTINKQLDLFFSSVKDKKLIDLIAEYEKTEPGSKHDELHAILGTQIEKLSPELEEHYKQFFSDRSALVQAYQDYEAVFEKYRLQITQLQDQINTLRNDLAKLESELATKRSQIDTVNRQLDEYRRRDNIAAYNVLVPEQNRLVREYNGLVNRYRDLVALHNSKVQALNKLALEQNELVDSLDSTKFEPL